MATPAAAFKQWLEEWTEAKLGDYVAKLKPYAKAPPRQKEFNDPACGTIVIEPDEVLLVDSPLFQRLRRIRQLGVAHWVYPGATHTRFEHSIGVLHNMELLIQAVNRTEREHLIDADERRRLRHAALCHDIGHGLMSHVSENALSRLEHIAEIRAGFAQERGLEQQEAPLSEIASFYIVGSPAFLHLLQGATEAARLRRFDQADVEWIQSVIIGRSPRDDFPLLHQLMSGPWDADKLDYTRRDALMAGVPVVTDIPRLIQKVRAYRVQEAALPKELRKRTVSGHTNYITMGIDQSGARTLDELVLGRTLLQDKIYQHQKTRAIEGMVALILEQLHKVFPHHPERMLFMVSDDQLLELVDEDQIRRLGEEGILDEVAVSTVSDISGRLANRELLVRALAFTGNPTLNPHLHDPGQEEALDELLETREDSELMRELRQDIAKRVVELLVISPRAPYSEWSAERLASYIWVDFPHEHIHSKQIQHAWVVDGERNTRRFQNEAAQARGWADSYLLSREIGFIYTTPELRNHVYIASEAVLREKYGLILPNMATQYAKLQTKDIDELKLKAANERFFTNLPLDLEPRPQLFQRSDVSATIDEVVTKLQGYQGPEGAVRVHGKIDRQLLRERIIDWASQFENDSDVESALKMLESLRFIGRAEFTTALESVLSTGDPYAIAPLGTVKDSGSIVAYWAADLSNRYNVQVLDLETAVQSGRKIVIVDDFISSGDQATTIFEDWMGAEKTVDLGEVRSSQLPDELQEKLKENLHAVVFSAGEVEGRNKLGNRLSDLGFKAQVHVQIMDSELPDVFQLTRDEDSGEFLNRLAQVGYELASSTSNKKVADRLLGYGNRGFLCLFPYNTPAQTVTALWGVGEVGPNGRQWRPLFPRRKKK